MTHEGTGETKLLHFSLNNQDYMIPLAIIKEVIRYQPITKVPTVPEVIQGVFNLRGIYVPVIDLAKRLDVSEKTVINNRSCILLTECVSNEQPITVGLLVDQVNEAISLDMASLSEAPKFGHSISNELIKGMFRANERDFIVLEVEKLLDLDALIELLEAFQEPNITA